MTRRLAAIMFTDIAGYTSLSQTDEAAALRLLEEQERLVHPLLELHRGRKVKEIGDGLLIEFGNALDAVECAVDLQQHIQQRNAREPPPELRVRIGVHLGDVQGAGADILGDAVNIASRIEPLADPGGVCLSESVYTQVRNKVSVPLEKLGEKSLKGVQEPVAIYRALLPGVQRRAESSRTSLPRIAILPLANISPDPRDEYLADGLTEELITVLSQIKGLRVVSRTSINQYKGTTKPIAQIGSELGADTILEGSVRKIGSQLRIAVQLIDTRTDEHRWSQAYDRGLENIFAIQADVAERTAGALKIELLSSERDAIREKPTSSLPAYEWYLQGLRAMGRFWGERQLSEETVIQCFEKAIREDSQFAAAYAHLGNFLIGLSGEVRPGKEVFPRARVLIAKALELDPASSEAHTARASLLFQADLDWKPAESEYQQAIALGPSNPWARYGYGLLLLALRRLTEAKRQYLAAIDLDPLWLLPRLNLVSIDRLLGDSASAIASCKRLLEQFPGNGWVLYHLGAGFHSAGRTADAVTVLRSIDPEPTPELRLAIAELLAVLGHPEAARELIAEIEAGSTRVYCSLDWAGRLYACLGDKEKALDCLERDFKDGDRALWYGYRGRGFDSIRDEPRFQALLRAYGLPTLPSRT